MNFPLTIQELLNTNPEELAEEIMNQRKDKLGGVTIQFVYREVISLAHLYILNNPDAELVDDDALAMDMAMGAGEIGGLDDVANRLKPDSIDVEEFAESFRVLSGLRAVYFLRYLNIVQDFDEYEVLGLQEYNPNEVPTETEPDIREISMEQDWNKFKGKLKVEDLIEEWEKIIEGNL